MFWCSFGGAGVGRGQLETHASQKWYHAAMASKARSGALFGLALGDAAGNALNMGDICLRKFEAT
jgi:hypothetical protein